MIVKDLFKKSRSSKNKSIKPNKRVKRKTGAQARRLEKPRVNKVNTRSEKQTKFDFHVLTQLKTSLNNNWLQGFLLFFLFALVIVWGQAKIQQMNWLPIQNVKINGVLFYLSKTQLEQQAKSQLEGGFFSVNLEPLKNKLLQQPWVESIAIRRVWPDTLDVIVKEKQAVAYWNKEQLLSANAILFTPKKLPKDLNLPQLIGPEGQHKNMYKELGKMQAWLLSTGLQIRKLKQDARRSWSIKINDGIEIRLGRKQRNERLQRLTSVFNRQLKKQQSHIQTIDMRYSNGFAVAWKEA